MKIRIKGNSVRYRLTRTDVERFAAEGVIKEETHIGDKVLSYILQRGNGDAISAEYINDTITVYMPLKMADEWTRTDRVGFENEAGPLSVYIEKDFKCLDNVAEGQSDNYPNPLAMQNT
jgi:hypothetical protein